MDVSVSTDAPTGAVVMTVAGEVDVVTSGLLRRELAAFVSSHRPHLVVDFRAVTFLDSTGLGVLVGAARQIRNRGGRVELVVDEGRVVDLLRLTAVARFFRIHPTVADAIAVLHDDP
jgi:anti-sigma B factor antagonist